MSRGSRGARNLKRITITPSGEGANRVSDLVHGGARTDQSSMTTHQQHQGAPDIHGKQGHHNRSHNAPDDKCVPLPLPDVANQTQRMMAQMLELLSVQRKAASVKEMYTQLNEWNKQKQVEWRHRMCTDL